MTHSALVLKEWDRLMRIVGRHDDPQDIVIIDGKSLDLAAVVAVAK